MATETNETPSNTSNNSLTAGLALLAGLGVILMITSAAVGVIQGTNANDELIGLLFWSGVVTFVAGAVAWGGVVRPWENFDDINVAQYTGHTDHHEEAHTPLPDGTTHPVEHTAAH
ncbi:MAG: hypothetical protein OHK0046_34610 [Anaerolineae bacterium]